MGRAGHDRAAHRRGCSQPALRAALRLGYTQGVKGEPDTAHPSSEKVGKRDSNAGHTGRVPGDEADQGRLSAAGDEASARGLSGLLARVVGLLVGLF